MSENLTKAEVFNNFVPEVLAELETLVFFADFTREHSFAFEFQTRLVEHQFNLSEEAAEKVVRQLRPNENQPPKYEKYPNYFKQLSQETKLNFNIAPDLFKIEELSMEKLTGIFSTVYGIEPGKLYSAMEYRIAASKCLDRNIPVIAKQYYQDNLVQYYTLLKAAIS